VDVATIQGYSFVSLPRIFQCARANPGFMDLPPPTYSKGDPKPHLDHQHHHHPKPKPPSNVLQCVTSLLDATKELTECLQLWSVARATEEQVSDVYVTVGTKFNLMVAAFMSVGIDMSELYSIPGELRVHLEECLGEEASPSILAQHMPAIKTTLYRLLVGLRGKQDAYWRAVGGSTASSRQSQQ